MNRDYLIFINVTLYKEVIAKFISPAVSQFVLVAFARAGIFAGHFLKIFYNKFDYILTDSVSLVKILENSKVDKNVFVFTIDFKSLYPTIPVEDGINSIKELVMEYNDVIPYAEFIIKLLNVILNNSLMTFNGEYFQKMFRVKMGTNVAPIHANIF